MIGKIGHIKNPLTIIAIFAGIAEISGTVILPFIHESNQNKYVWFLMLFPAMLVTIFFITLWYKPKSLYAPSDYSNEENFVKMMEPATYVEISAKAEKEAIDFVHGEAAPAQYAPSAPSAADETITNRLPPDETEATTVYEVQQVRHLVSEAEDKAFAVLANEFPAIRRNVALRSGTGRRVFDGIADGPTNLSIFEIKMTKYPRRPFVIDSVHKFVDAVTVASIKSALPIRLVLVVVVHGDLPKTPRFREVLSHRDMKVEVRYMQF